MSFNIDRTPTDTVIAIDPGSHESGCAIYQSGRLMALRMCALFELPALVAEFPSSVWVIENVLANRFIYSRRAGGNRATAARKAQNVGMVKQAQRGLEECLAHYGIEPVRIKPMGGNWGSISTTYGKQALVQHTGWAGSSNKDTRSAAFFGWLYLRQQSRYRKRQ